MRDSLAEHQSDITTEVDLPSLQEWLVDQTELLAEYWHREIVRRGGVSSPEVVDLLREFTGFIASLVPYSVSPERGPASDVWRATAELYGSMGAVRGLAAGEVVEELQILREGILRVVFHEPPVLSGADLKLREALLINRFVDALVMQASVSHTDDLFFQLIERSGVPASPRTELLDEIREQLGALQSEARSLG